MQGEPATRDSQASAVDAAPKVRIARFAPHYLRVRRRTKQFYLLAKGALLSSLSLTGWLVGFVFLVLIYQEITTERTVIQAISVPKSFAESGLTPEAAARRLQDAMSALLFEANSSGSSNMRVSVGMDLPEIVVPTVGLSLTTLASFMRTFLGLPSRRLLSGELVEYEKKAQLVLRLNATEIYRSPDPVSVDRLDELWSAAAEAALRRISPYHVALSLYDTRPKQAVDIAHYLIRYYPADDENVAWAHIIVGMRARDYLRFADARREFNAALAIAEKSRSRLSGWLPWSPRGPSYASVAQVQLGSTLYEQGHFEAAVTALRQASSMDQTDAGARHYLGVARTRLESKKRVLPDFDEANKLLRKAIHEYDRQGGAGARGEATVHRSLGNALMQQERPGAEAEFQEAMRLDPGDQRSRAGFCGVLHANWGLGRERGVFNSNYDRCVSWLRQDMTDAYSQILLAEYLVVRTKRAEAIEALREALKTGNDRPQVHAKLGSLYADDKNWDAAIRELSKAIELAPEAAMLHNDVGDAYYKKGDFLQAEKAYRAAIARNPGNAIYHVNLALALEGQASPTAEAEHREALKLAAHSDTEFNNVGSTLYNKGEFERAAGAYRKALEIEPANPIFHGYLASALTNLGQLDSAAAAYLKAIALEPENAGHHNQLANVFFRKSDFTKAVDAYRKAIDVEPENATFHANLARALRYLKQPDLAIATYQKAIELEPRNANHHNSVGNAFYEKEDFTNAAEAYRKAIAIDPSDAQMHSNLAGALRKLQQVDAAMEEYQRAIALKPEDAEYRDNLGGLLYDKNDFAGAAEAARKAVAIAPRDDRYRAHLGMALRGLQQFDVAIEELRHAIELKPGNAVYLNQLGEAFADKGSFAEAAEAYRKAIEIEPGETAYRDNLAAALSALEAREPKPSPETVTAPAK